MGGIMISGDRQRSAADRDDNARRVASGFAKLGVVADKCVAIYLRNDFEFFEASTACGLLGAYATPINWHYTAAEAGFILRDCDASVVVIHSDILPKVIQAIPDSTHIVVVDTPAEITAAYRLAAPADIAPQDARPLISWQQLLADCSPWTGVPPALRGSMIYTSGTTGNPKGVKRAPMDEAQQATVVDMVKDGFGVPPDASDACSVMTGPMYHSAPNAYGLAMARNGAKVILQPRFDAEQLLQIIDQHKVTHLHAVPTMFVRLLRLPQAVRQRYDVSSLIHVVHGAAPCAPETKRQMIDWWGHVIYEYYGSTENGLMTVVTSELALRKPGTVGKSISGVKIRVLDDQLNTLPAGDIGEIYVRHPSRGDFTYHKRDDARAQMDIDGYLTNGDMGWLDDEQCLYLADRKNDMVISGGVNIYPAEIEKALIECPGVKDCAVFGIPNAEFGESLAAHIEIDDRSVTEQGVKDFLRRSLAGFKVPSVVAIEESLPREDSGKIFKRKLRDPYWAGMKRRI